MRPRARSYLFAVRLRAVLPPLVALAVLSSASAARGPSLELVANAPKPRVVNSDVAFWGNVAYQGNYDGFRVIDISKPKAPVVLADVRCHGPQNDISVWRKLVFLSVDRPQTSPGCDSVDAAGLTDPTSFEGIRIFDASDRRNPHLIASVPTDCGSHTHTLVPDLAHDRLLLYVSSYALRDGPHCGAGREADPLHGKISIVAVPLAAPQTAAVVATPAVQAPVFGAVSRDTRPTVGCHDISVFMPLHLAAAACMSEGQLWDISDPLKPRVLRHIDHPAVEFWHSATFSWNGKIVVFGDESLTGSCNSPREQDGRLWFYSVAKPAKPLASFLIDAPETEYCSVHMFNTIPLAKGRNVLVSGWYEGGTRVIDFTDPRKPRQLAANVPPGADEWSGYWYDGTIYASDLGRGLDVLALAGDTAKGARKLGHLNPQTQELAIR
jgi:hypothetical protein